MVSIMNKISLRKIRSIVKRHKMESRLFLIALCIVFTTLLFLCGVAHRFQTSPSELLLRCVFAWQVLTQKPKPIPPPAEVFRLHICDPLPESVEDIKVDRPKYFMGYRYVIRFSIDKADIHRLVKSVSLKRIWNIRYERGNLHWDWDKPGRFGISKHSTTMIVYNSKGPGRPKWFRLELWHDSESYAFTEKIGGKTNTKVLIYNEEKGQAYFIVESL